MPRYYNDKQEGIDLCRECWAEVDSETFNRAEDGGCWDAPHPPYDDTSYHCEGQGCGVDLTHLDD